MSVQSEGALARANEIRGARAAVKRAVCEGTTTVGAVLEARCCSSMLLFDLLCLRPDLRSRARGLRKSVQVQVGEMLAEWRISESRRIGELTERQRRLISESEGLAA
jgi:hypothetical protein